MKSFQRFRIPVVTVTLGLLDVAILVAILWQLFAGTPSDNSGASVRDTGFATIDLSIPTAPATFDTMQSQALFHQSRSFYVEPPSPAIPPPPPDYRLSGSIALPNKPLTALLINNQTSARIKVAVGEEIEGWLVEEVASKRVLIKQGARTAEISSTSRQAAVSSPTASLQDIPSARQGLTIVPTAQPLQQQTPAGVRVLTGGSRPPSPSANHSQRQTISEARLYRPPQQ